MVTQINSGVFTSVKLQNHVNEQKIIKHFSKAIKNIKGIKDAIFKSSKSEYDEKQEKIMNMEIELTSGDSLKRNDRNRSHKSLLKKQLMKGTEKIKKILPKKPMSKKDSDKIKKNSGIITKLLDIEEFRRKAFLINFVAKENQKRSTTINSNTINDIKPSIEANTTLNYYGISKELNKDNNSRNHLNNNFTKKVAPLTFKELNLLQNVPIISNREQVTYQSTTNSNNYTKMMNHSLEIKENSEKKLNTKELNTHYLSKMNRVSSKLKKKTDDTRRIISKIDHMKDNQFDPTFLTFYKNFNTANFNTECNSNQSDQSDYFNCINKQDRKLDNDNSSCRSSIVVDYSVGKFEENHYFQSFTPKNTSFYPKNNKIYNILKSCNEWYQKSEHLKKEICKQSTITKSETKKVQEKYNPIVIGRKKETQELGKMKRKVIFSENSQGKTKILHLHKDNIFIKNQFVNSISEINAYSNRFHLIERFDIKLKNSEYQHFNMKNTKNCKTK